MINGSESLHDECGPGNLGVVRDAQTIVDQAVDAVLADFSRTGRRGQPDSNWVDWSRAVFESSATGADIVVEIAGNFQEFHSQVVYCWPECGEHNVGLYPIVRDGLAVWWCVSGNHAIASIGHLGE